MGLIAVADLNALLDGFVSAYMLNASSAMFTALDGAYTGLGATGNIDAISDLARALAVCRDAQNGLVKFGADSTQFLAQLNRHVKRFATGDYSDLNSYLTFENVGGGGTWTALQHYLFGDIFNQVFGRPNLTVRPNPWNLYYEILNGGATPNGLRKLIVGTGQTAGASVPTSSGAPLYAGGDPKLVSAGITGTGTVTVTGTSYDPVSKAFSVGVTWTAAVVANGTMALTPGTAPANSKIQAVSNIAAAVGLSAGTFIVIGAKPAGRL